MRMLHPRKIPLADAPLGDFLFRPTHRPEKVAANEPSNSSRMATLGEIPALSFIADIFPIIV